MEAGPQPDARVRILVVLPFESQSVIVFAEQQQHHPGVINMPLDRRYCRCAPVLVLALILFSLSLSAQSVKLPAGVVRVTSVEGITEYALPNGLRVLLFPDQTKQTTTVNITYLVGSRHENYGETGMAHLL